MPRSKPASNRSAPDQCAPCRRTPRGPATLARAIGAALLLGLALGATPALALKSDKDQPMDVAADFSRSEGDKEISVKKTIYLRGNVVTAQGTIKSRGDDAVIYMDKDAGVPAKGVAPSTKSKTQRLILTGKLAHMEEMQDDDGGLMTADAAKLDYKLDTHIVEMTGNVTVVQQKQGSFHGEHMIYNTLTGELVSGDDTPAGRVHIVLQPKEDKNDTPKPPALIKPPSGEPGIPAPPKKKSKAATPPGAAPATPPPATPPASTDGH